jgi:hypothetical protein
MPLSNFERLIRLAEEKIAMLAGLPLFNRT